MKGNQTRMDFKYTATGISRQVVQILLLASLLLSVFFTQAAVAQEVYIQTGFEEFTLGKPPKDWVVSGEGFEVTNDTVKTDKKSLAILLGGDDDTVGVPIETDNPVITVEFWVYITGGGRSFNFKIITTENIGENNGGAYINWDANAVRLYDGGAWRPIDDFDTDVWKYVRVVADVGKSEFDFYVGDDRDKALKAKGEKGLPFRNAAVNPVARWVAFHVYSIAAVGYVDDLFIYEGDEPINLAVDPMGKLTTFWGHIKHR